MAHIQVKFFTSQTEYAVPSSSILVPIHFRRKALSEIINHLLGKADGKLKYCVPHGVRDFWIKNPNIKLFFFTSSTAFRSRFMRSVGAKVDFDFLIEGQLLRTPLNDYLTQKGLSTENTLNVEYVVALPAPKPLTAFQTDDWISSISILSENEFLSTGYDGVVTLWNAEGKVLSQAQVATSPLKSICGIETSKRVVVGHLNHKMTMLDVGYLISIFCINTFEVNVI